MVLMRIFTNPCSSTENRKAAQRMARNVTCENWKPKYWITEVCEPMASLMIRLGSSSVR